VKNRYPDVFSPGEEITASNEGIATVISYLQSYALLRAPYDVIGTACCEVLGDITLKDLEGAVQVLEPGDSSLDIRVGTGFLTRSDRKPGGSGITCSC